MTPADAPLYLADHPLLFAVPVLIPVLVIVLVVGGVVWRDRRAGGDDEEATPRSDAGE